MFECSPYLGAAMTEQEWCVQVYNSLLLIHKGCRSNAWSNEANRIAQLFSAMSNHASYVPSLLFVVWSTEHVAQHSEAIMRKASPRFHPRLMRPAYNTNPDNKGSFTSCRRFHTRRSCCCCPSRRDCRRGPPRSCNLS